MPDLLYYLLLAEKVTNFYICFQYSAFHRGMSLQVSCDNIAAVFCFLKENQNNAFMFLG
jgi:hypothetical protein